MTIRITSKELIRLDELIRLYYGNEINIYVMHGLIVSYLCSASTEKFEDLLFDVEHREPLFPMLGFEDDIISPEFLPLFLGKLFNKTIDLSNSGTLICPLVTTEKFNAKFNHESLSLELKRNLLDWYMGYFQGFMYFWDHDAIHNYLEHPSNNNDIIGSVVTERFVSALNMHYVIAYNLISELKPKYMTKDFKYSVKKVKETVKDFSEMESFIVEQLLKLGSRESQISSEIIEIAHAARKLMDAGAVISANDPSYTRH